MVLSSQGPRADRGGRRSPRRRRASRRLLMLVFLPLAALLLGLGYRYLLPASPEPSPEPAGEQAPDPRASNRSAPDPSASAANQPDPSRPAQGASALPTVGVSPQPTTTPPEPDAPRPKPTADPQPVVRPAGSQDPPSDVSRPPRSALPRSGDPLVQAQLLEGQRLLAEGKLIEGRRTLSELLTRSGYDLPADQAAAVRERLTQLSDKLVFSPHIQSGDPLVTTYTVQSGDYLSRIVPPYDVPYQLIELINQTEARRIRVGQELKIIKGPFHVLVDKSDFRMDAYLLDADGQPLYIRSFPVGLGEGDSTPVGRWVVMPGSKIENPGWTNPRNGKVFEADDPENPIGEYWMGLSGLDDQTKGLRGYGIHGTTDPDSIGREMSMGCVRMADADIELVYKMLEPGKSTVVIQK